MRKCWSHAPDPTLIHLFTHSSNLLDAKSMLGPGDTRGVSYCPWPPGDPGWVLLTDSGTFKAGLEASA